MTTVASGDTRLRVAILTGLFSSVTVAVYIVARADVTPVVEVFLSAGPLMAVVLWLQKDAERTGVGAVQDLGFFAWLAWPIVLPWYVLETRGRRGWALILALIAVILSPYLTAFAFYAVSEFLE